MWNLDDDLDDIAWLDLVVAPVAMPLGGSKFPENKNKFPDIWLFHATYCDFFQGNLMT